MNTDTMNRNNIIHKFLLLILIITGCDEKEKMVPLQGDIVGFVSLYNEDGSSRDDHSNVTVTLNEKYTVLTNEIGKFEFKNIEAGTYTITYQKEGYSKYKKFNYIFAGGGVPGVLGTISMIGVPDVTLSNLVIKLEGESVRISGTLSSIKSDHIKYYLHQTSYVSNIDYGTSYSFIAEEQEIMDIISISGIHSSMPIYITAYIESKGNNSNFNYYDYELNSSVNSAMTQLFEPVQVR
ncbi:MAG TPA: carboxypeptidase-like regulatory domain-containing protein [Ohtaekwangia sp.]|nr:carboxypeptidase-like regulatory domain-containing protein [Ohtaekwangia sp.]